MIGTMSTPADVQLEGEFEGDIQAHHAIVGEHATLTGHLGAEEVTIRGVVDGIVKARLVRLAGTARVDGDVYHASLEVEAGATLTGRCVRSDDPRNVKENGQKSMGAQSRPQLTSGERNTKRDDKNDAA
jgi:cytoskeletal protein CcmA (bactofilin family)